MSDHTIHCPECSYDNAAGSKFCNNCGARLPQSTNIICPRCQTPNSRDRLYCDNCGSRLILEAPPPEPPPATDEPGPDTKAFSLPTRQPGDTGELDPDAVPDWLKTGQGPPAPENLPLESESELPRLEDLTPKNRDTDDLPDWLVDEDDADPIVHAPTFISTEHFQDLWDRASKDEAGPDTADLLSQLGAEEAQLPDWLAATSSNQGAEPETAAYSEDDNLDWLAALSQPHKPDDQESDEESRDEIGVTDWLTSLGPASETEGSDVDWLVDTDELSLPSAAADTAAPDAADKFLWGESDDEELETAVDEPASDDWLAELGPPQTNILGYDDPKGDTGAIDEEPFFGEEQLPDWMEELGPPQTNIFDDTPVQEEPESDPVISLQEIPQPVDQDLPDWLAGIDDDAAPSDSTPGGEDETDQSWLSESPFPAGTTSLDWLDVTGTLPADPTGSRADKGIEFDQLDDSFMDTEPPVVSHSPDWLSELASLDTGELVDDDEPEELSRPYLVAGLPDKETAVDSETTLDTTQARYAPLDEINAADDSDEAIGPASDETWLSTGSFLEEPLDSELPDWLTKLDNVTTTDSANEDLIPSEDLPDWVAQLRPDEGQEGLGLTTAIGSFEMDTDVMEDIPADLAGAELPDWLQDVSPVTGSSLRDRISEDVTTSAEIPDWILGDDATADAAFFSGSDQDSSAEWDHILANLPPAEELARAELPEWVQALKPAALKGEAESPAPSQPPTEDVGPLAGYPGVVAIEPIIALPRTHDGILTFTVTKEQQAQAALLQQLTRTEPAASPVVATATQADPALWLRLALALLLLAAVVVGLVGPNLLQTTIPAPSARVTAVHDILAANNGKPVLVAFDYTPAMAGDVDTQAQLLVAELAAANTPIFTLSQYAAGTMLARPDVPGANLTPLGFIPAEAIGLRQVGNCVATSCTSLAGTALDAATQQTLNEVELVIVFTAERDSLVNWLEQVTTPHDLTLIAGVSQSLAPIAAPYLANEQIQGMLAGLPDTAVYQQAFGVPDEANLLARMQAQSLASLLAAILLLLGGIVFGISGAIRGRSNR